MNDEEYTQKIKE